MLLLARIVPFLPLSLVGYVAGAARVPLWRYTWTSTVGIIPITAAATYLGHSIDDFSSPIRSSGWRSGCSWRSRGA